MIFKFLSTSSEKNRAVHEQLDSHSDRLGPFGLSTTNELAAREDVRLLGEMARVTERRSQLYHWLIMT